MTDMRVYEKLVAQSAAELRVDCNKVYHISTPLDPATGKPREDVPPTRTDCNCGVP